MSTIHQMNMSVGDGGAVHMPPKEAVYSDLLSLGVSARKSHVEFAAQAGGQYKPASKNIIETLRFFEISEVNTNYIFFFHVKFLFYTLQGTRCLRSDELAV